MSRRLAVLASGKGSLLQAMVDRNLPIELVITDRDCKAFDIADEAGIGRVNLKRSFGNDFDQTAREAYTEWVLRELRDHKISLVAMAGYMTVFTPAMFAEDAFKMRILNTHPSLLPSFKGDRAVQDALDYGVKVTGCTIHYATEELDAGPILTQEAVRVLPGDTVESLHERIKVVERQLYPALLRMLIN